MRHECCGNLSKACEVVSCYIKLIINSVKLLTQERGLNMVVYMLDLVVLYGGLDDSSGSHTIFYGYMILYSMVNVE